MGWNVTLVQTWTHRSVLARDPPWLARVRATNERYALSRGYRYQWIAQRSSFLGLGGWGTHLNKVRILARLLQTATSRDIIFFLDTDAVVFNHSVAAELLMGGGVRDIAPDLVMPGYPCGTNGSGRVVRPRTPSGSPSGINSGVFLVRGTDWSRRLVALWLALDGRRRQEGITVPGDQVLLAHMQQHGLMAGWHEHVAFVPAWRLNTADADARCRPLPRIRAEFVLHLYGSFRGHIDEALDDVERGLTPRILERPWVGAR
tara:strand:- start:1514 stop:2293 length:780 start_codon:yes stop_codon:yes gene_type:complete